MPEIVWTDDLIWCPSQCYADVEDNGTKYVLYLRWRYCDPWVARVIKGVDSEKFMRSPGDGVWSCDVFRYHKKNWARIAKLEHVKLSLMEIWKEAVEKNELEKYFKKEVQYEN